MKKIVLSLVLVLILGTSGYIAYPYYNTMMEEREKIKSEITKIAAIDLRKAQIKFVRCIMYLNILEKISSQKMARLTEEAGIGMTIADSIVGDLLAEYKKDLNRIYMNNGKGNSTPLKIEVGRLYLNYGCDEVMEGRF